MGLGTWDITKQERAMHIQEIQFYNYRKENQNEYESDKIIEMINLMIKESLACSSILNIIKCPEKSRGKSKVQKKSPGESKEFTTKDPLKESKEFTNIY
ncbi:hypothetical protein C2G38_2241690 [Gigaspora rosea]|uniref:Uncharacterized protein n=1 Tax=Gigaspora rosea TaxID=44941 RepID=A0A397VTB5_9GLOM|nr:hypothetical protein C2G38_2241690 [Gigaspora rosea]